MASLDQELPSLHQWAIDHQPDSKMLWKESYWNQVMFVRDTLTWILTRTYGECKDLVKVYNTHTSKSILCPVYYLHLPKEGVEIWMRNNFHNWNISVQSEREIVADFLGVFDPDSLHYCFCEGMEDKKFESYSKNHSQFTVCIGSQYDVYVFCKVLQKFLGITREK